MHVPQIKNLPDFCVWTIITCKFTGFMLSAACIFLLLAIWNLIIDRCSLFHHQEVTGDCRYFLDVLFSQAKKDHTLWELLTFKFVNPMMDTGITRQLDFTDLLELPAELRATSCYDRLLSCWTAEYQNHHNDSSLLRAMFCSYGWTYLRLGLLKVSFSFY